MSALGEYIHLYTRNYIEYGVSRNNRSDSFKYQRMEDYIQRRTKNLKGVQNSTLETLRYRIAGDSDTLNDRERNQVQHLWQKNLNRVYNKLASFTSKELMDNWSLDNESFQSSSNQHQNRLAFSYTDDISTFILHRRKIKNLIDKINERHFADKNQIDRINEEYEILQRLIENTGSQIHLPFLPEFKENDNIDKIISFCGKFQKKIDNIHLINMDTQISGDFGEYLVYSARDTIWDGTIKELNNTIKQGIVGGEAHGGYIPIEVFKEPLPERAFTIEGDTYKITPSQDKVDAQIIINREEVFASAKAYKDLFNHGGAKLQADMRLITTLAYLNNTITDFGNHWLNMHAASSLGSIMARRRRDFDNSNLIFKQELAYEALVVGNPWKQGVKEAEVFVAIDRTSGKVMALNTQDMLVNYFNCFKFLPAHSRVENIQLQRNQRSNTIENRIKNILADFHEFQVTVYFNVNRYVNSNRS